MQNFRLDDLIINQQDNPKLKEALCLVRSRAPAGSLSAYDKFDFAKLYQFRQIYQQEIDLTITGSEPFSEEILASKKERVSLPNSIYDLLVRYYNNTYETEGWKFVSIAEYADAILSNSIIVLPFVDQFCHIRIATKIFGSVTAP
jgi:hypothetical protein